MKPNFDPSDPFQEMLTGDAAHLPQMAAQEAREFRAQRRRRRTQAALVALLGVCCWQAFHSFHSVPKEGDLAQNLGQQPALARTGNFVMAQTTEEAVSKPLPTPSRATQEQKDLLESVRGLPLLVVMDGSGKPTRIVVLEQ